MITFILGTILGIVIIFGSFLLVANHPDHIFSISVEVVFLLYYLGYVLYLID